jgi:glyoxylase-like metal-dependent hydrolase (beta-lactamase superfamily II)
VTVPSLPAVEQVAPDLWSIPVPIPLNPLRYVLVYALVFDEGLAIVDAGWNTEEAFSALQDGIRRMGGELADVRAVLVTHIHPDHYGLAGRVRESSGAWIGMHPRDAVLIESRYEDPDDLLRDTEPWLRAAGVPDEEVWELRSASLKIIGFVSAVRPDRLLEDGSAIHLPGWRIQAVWTPGHSPGHLCYHVPDRGLLFTGDHVLPRITPTITKHPQSAPDPLGDYLDSLRKVAGLEADDVLPGHEWRFRGLERRVAEIIAHHDRRLREHRTVLGRGPSTAWEVAMNARWSRPWEEIEPFMRRAALAETVAHLHFLERRGEVVALPGVPVRYRLRD